MVENSPTAPEPRRGPGAGSFARLLDGLLQGGGALLLVVGAPGLLLAGYGWEGAAVAVLAGSASLVLAQMDRVAELSGWGWAAKLREAQAVAEEAKASAAELRSLALGFARVTLGLGLQSSFPISRIPAADLAHAEAEKLLRRIKATPEERQTAFAEWSDVMHYEAARLAADAIARAAGKGRDQATWRPTLVTAGRPPKIASAATFRTTAQQMDALTPEVEAQIAALEEGQSRIARNGVLDSAPGWAIPWLNTNGR